MAKVVAINGSPKMEKGNTAKILTPFLEGMEKAGASVELFYAKRLNVKPALENSIVGTRSQANATSTTACNRSIPNCETQTSSCWQHPSTPRYPARCRT